MAFSYSMSSNCLGCGRELPIPKKGTANRILYNANDDAEMFLDTDAKCSQCGNVRVRIRFECEVTVDIIGEKP